MTRDPRFCMANLTYHTYSRCINNSNMIKDDKTKELMITVIKETQEKYHFELSGFEILDNHFHFLIKTLDGGQTISKIMQRIKSVFARRYNKLHGRTGPFWNERFGSKIIEDAIDATTYLLHLLWYMAYNSFRKNKVNNPRDYKYSSINCYLDENYKSCLTIKLHNSFINLGKTFQERLRGFLIFEDNFVKGLWYQK
jgi:putative transposase